MVPEFKDRREAGELLGCRLLEFSRPANLLVFALPRGGVPVGFEVAKYLQAPLDVFMVRKLGVPGSPELAMGALAAGGVRVLNEEIIRQLRISDEVIETVTREEARELERREHAYRGARPPVDPGGATVILIDDGLATGSTMRAAVAAVRQQKAVRVVVAVPVAAVDTAAAFKREVDDFVCLLTPEPFDAVGRWYRNFAQTPDEEVRALLERARGITQGAAC